MAETKTKNKRDRAAAASAVANPDAGSGKGFTLAIIGILVVGLAGLAFVVTQRDAPDFDVQTAPVEIEGDLLVPMPSSGVSADPASDRSVGQPLPSITGTDFNGNTVSISDDGRAKAIYFLAHWCPHCQAELPRVVELMNDGSQPDNLDVYAISTSFDATRGMLPELWFKQENFEGPIIRDSDGNDALIHFGGGGFPYAVYADANNNVVARSSGELPTETIAAMWQAAASGGSTDAG